MSATTRKRKYSDPDEEENHPTVNHGRHFPIAAEQGDWSAYFATDSEEEHRAGSPSVKSPLAGQTHFTENGTAVPTPGSILGGTGPGVDPNIRDNSAPVLRVPAAVYLEHIQGQQTARQLVKLTRTMAELTRTMAMTKEVLLPTPEADAVLAPGYEGEPLLVEYMSIKLAVLGADGEEDDTTSVNTSEAAEGKSDLDGEDGE